MTREKKPRGAMPALACAFLSACALVFSCEAYDGSLGDLPLLELTTIGERKLSTLGVDGIPIEHLVEIEASNEGFGIKTLDEFGAETDVSLAGLEPDHSFSIECMGPARGAGVSALEAIAKGIGLMQLDSSPVLVRIDGSFPRHALLRERPSRGENRIATDKLATEDYGASKISGGYIISVSRNGPSRKGISFQSDLGFSVTVDYPDRPNADQLDYLKNAYRSLEYYLAYDGDEKIRVRDAALRFIAASLFSLEPSEKEDLRLVKRRSDDLWITGPFQDLARSPLLDEGYIASKPTSTGVFLEIVAKKTDIADSIPVEWAILRSGVLSDEAIAEIVGTSFCQAGLQRPGTDESRLVNRLLARARYLDAKLKENPTGR